ncbi:MAG: transcription repressor NadR [Spirochaetes bacterium]|nr:transcription repressor NadR [Spirochaetota bacterium]
MESRKRKEYILNLLRSREGAVSGSELAKELGISRQIIIRDIAVLRAMGHRIEATYKGYAIGTKKGSRALFAVKHSSEDIERELSLIVRAGGKIINVIVEHPLYGEIKGNIQVESLSDVKRFLARMKTSYAKPLLALSDGIHLHTVEAVSTEQLEKIRQVLKENGFLISSD